MTKATSEELGLRSDIIPKVTLAVALFRIDFSSELAYDADAGVNEASAPSRREGFEVSGQYRPFPWIELNADVASARARYFTGNPATYDLPGAYVANAPNFIGSFGILINHLGSWYGGAQFRWLGGYPLIEDNSFRSPGYKELNLSVGYHFTHALQGEMAVYNVSDTHASASQYAYEYRVSPTSAPQTGSPIILWNRGLFVSRSAMASDHVALRLQHAVDADPIASIDNVTRKLMQMGQRSLTIRLWFAVGHSAVVVIAAFGAVVLTHAMQTRLGVWRDIGGIISTIVSAGFLFVLAITNLHVLRGTWRTYRLVQAGGTFDRDQVDIMLGQLGVLACSSLLGRRQ